jgi:glycosyltransferase involved in cell wall biosynthesis
MMKIGFDAKRFFFNQTGLGNYSRTLIYGFLEAYPQHSYLLFSPRYARPENRFEGFAQLKTILPDRKPGFFWRQSGINKQIEDSQVQIFHGLSHELPLKRAKNNYLRVVTMHDLIYELYPGLFPKTDAFLYKLKYRYACQTADKVIAISQSTKNDLIKLYQIADEKISVVYQSCNPAFTIKLATETLTNIRHKYQLPSEFILSVGSIIERKNLIDIIKAMAMCQPENRIPIVAIGNGKEYLHRVLQFVAENKLEKWFYHLPHISNQELPAFYQMAKIFVYTSSYEGFGIPVLEALYSGTPVITSNVSSLPEAGGNAALLVNPRNVEELHFAIEKVLNDTSLSSEMIAKGYLHAQKFSDKSMAKDTMNVYESII